MCKTKTLWFNSDQEHFDEKNVEKILIVEHFTVVRLVELFRRQNFRGPNLEQNLNCIRLVPHFFSINFAYKIFNSIYKARHSCKKMCAFFGADETKMNLSNANRPTWLMKINFCRKHFISDLDYRNGTKITQNIIS